MANFPTTLPSSTPATHGEENGEIVAMATALINAKMVKAQRTAGNVTVTSTTPVAMDTALDLTLTGAVTGQWVSLGISCFWDDNPTGAASGYSLISFGSLVSAAIVNYIHTGTSTFGNGVSGWFTANGAFISTAGTFPYQLQAADISGGSAVFRLMAAVGAGSRPLRANTTDILTVWAERLPI